MRTQSRRTVGIIGVLTVAVIAVAGLLWPAPKSTSDTDEVVAATPVHRGAEPAPGPIASHASPATLDEAGPSENLAPTVPDPDAESQVHSTPVDPGDTAIESIESHRSDFPDTPVGRLLTHHMFAAEGMGPDAEAIYQESLEALRVNPREATNLLDNAYQEMEENRYLDRWKVVDTLAELGTHEALEVLSEIAEQPVPLETAAEEEHFSSQSEEQMIRAAAISGIEELASRGVTEADTELYRLASVPDPVVRESAVLAYRRSGTDQQARTTELKGILTVEDHWMVELQEVADVSLMPQPDPQEADPHTGEAGAEQTERGTFPAGDPGTGTQTKTVTDPGEPAKEESLPPTGI